MIEMYGDICIICVVNNLVVEEDEDNCCFMFDVGKWLDIEIEEVINDKWFNNVCVDVWEKKCFMFLFYGVFCMVELKKGVR